MRTSRRVRSTTSSSRIRSSRSCVMRCLCSESSAASFGDTWQHISPPANREWAYYRCDLLPKAAMCYMIQVAHPQWSGVMHAVVTPFDADGALDEAAFVSNVAAYL